MARTVTRAVSLGLCIALVGCTSWPKATAVTSPQLATTPVRSIDILPLDLEVWTHDGYVQSPETVRARAELDIIGATTGGIQQRGYKVNALFDWGGNYTGPGGAPAEPAIAPADLLATLDSLASYGSAVNATNKVPAQYRTKAYDMPFPYLPVKLGDRTGADATLYIGGWGFVGKEPDTAGTVALVVIGVILIVGIIALAAAASDGKDSGVADSVAKAGRGVAKAAASMGRIAARTAVGAGKVVLNNAGAIADVADAFGHATTHVTLVAGRPEYAEDPALPREGKPELYLEMTLVDNRTGVALWHAQQRFPANAAKPDDVKRATRALLATLPRHIAPALAVTSR